MLRIKWLLPCLLFCIVFIFSGVSRGQLWSGVLAPSRAIDWSNAGAGNIPARPSPASNCATLNPGATSAQINSAISSCSNGGVVYLNAGVYPLTGSLVVTTSNVTLRGAGADKTFLVWTKTSSGCNGLGPVAICIWNGDGEYINAPSNLASWIAGYIAGTNSITLGSVSKGTIGTLHVGSLLVLDQKDDASDTGNIFMCETTGSNGTCSQQGSSGVAKTGRAQAQQVTVTSISGNGPWTVGITPGLYAPNWRSSQSPEAWWANTLPVSGFGLEDLSTDVTAVGDMNAVIQLHNASRCWIKGIRSVNASTASGNAARNHVLMWQSTHITVRDSYFFGSTPSSSAYGVDSASTAADNLIENNIFQHIAVGTALEGTTGTVFGYNYAVDNNYAGSWQQTDGMHHSAGDYYNLWEGHEGIEWFADNIHGSSFMLTNFRGYWSGHDTATGPAPTQAKTDATFAYFPFAYARYNHLIGSVLGTQSYHTAYQSVPSSSTDCGGNASHSVMVLGFSDQNGTAFTPGCLGTGFTIYNDSLVPSTLMRWGNYAACSGDPACNVVRFVPGEDASGAPSYPGLSSPSQSLPPSFYLSNKPSWWGSVPWPAVGPEVTGGDIPNVGGHAYHNPAANCYLNVMGGKTNGLSGALTFNADNCYSASNVPPPTGLTVTVH